jgi:hypothetical protein
VVGVRRAVRGTQSEADELFGQLPAVKLRSPGSQVLSGMFYQIIPDISRFTYRLKSQLH